MATVADGRWRQPRLVSEERRRAGPPLPERDVATLRRLMRAVVTEGTGEAVAGDLAAAVLVERGRSGGSVAAPIAACFFASLDPVGR